MLAIRNVGCACHSYVDVVIPGQEEQVSLWAELNGAWRDVSIRRKPILGSTSPFTPQRVDLSPHLSTDNERRYCR
jgi:hypothetical protein